MEMIHYIIRGLLLTTLNEKWRHKWLQNIILISNFRFMFLKSLMLKGNLPRSSMQRRAAGRGKLQLVSVRQLREQ